MVGTYLKAARPALATLCKQQHLPSIRRSLFIPSAARSADLVQQMYLKELQAYKPAPIKANDSEGVVQKFSIPKPPLSPEEANIANELKEYEAQQPEIEGQQAESGAVIVEENWFEEEEDELKTAH